MRAQVDMEKVNKLLSSSASTIFDTLKVTARPPPPRSLLGLARASRRELHRSALRETWLTRLRGAHDTQDAPEVATMFARCPLFASMPDDRRALMVHLCQ